MKKPILSFVREVKIAAQPAITTSEDYFKEAGIVLFGGNFKAQFLGLAVPVVDEAELVVRRIEKTSFNAIILAKLGDKAEIAVSQFTAFLAANRESREWFAFYLRGRNGKLWAVDARWSGVGRGWGVGAYSVDSPLRWYVGNRVVSR